MVYNLVECYMSLVELVEDVECWFVDELIVVGVELMGVCFCCWFWKYFWLVVLFVVMLLVGLVFVIIIVVVVVNMNYMLYLVNICEWDVRCDVEEKLR